MTSSNYNPQAGVSNVYLTCHHDTDETISSYEWYKDDAKIDTATAEKYQLPTKAKGDGGSFQCKVVTTQSTSVFSDKLVVEFLCKLNVFSIFWVFCRILVQ